MDFIYSRHNITSGEKKLERILEILPGALSWSIIIGMCALSFIKPILAAVIMIAFLLYWVLKLIYMNIFLVFSYMRLAIERDVDWMERIEDIDKLDSPIKACRKKVLRGVKSRILNIIYCRQLNNLKKSGRFPVKSEHIYHLIIIPVIKETKDVVEPGIIGIKKGGYPSSRIIIIIAVEDRASGEVKVDMEKLRERYKKDFLDIMIAIHPNNIAGEAAVKGANAAFAAKKASRYLKEHNIPHENVIVSCFDADTVPNSDYFSCLTYHYMITPGRASVSFQPIPVYHNNIWDAPAFARIIDIGASFFQLIEATNPRKLVTFSSHSMSFKALVDIGYWPCDMISDDSAVFWKAFIHYDGNYQTVPMYTTVSMDIAVGKTIRKTFEHIYKQKRRWAWGVENFPIVMRAFLKSKSIPLYSRISHGFKLLDAFVSWATWSFLLTFICWLPAVFAGREFATSTVYYIAPRIRGAIFSLASCGIIICMIISLLLLPKIKTKLNFIKRIMHVFEWLLIPVIVLVLSALPALDAQTRLMSGRYMEFWVTEKHRRK